ncbi:MAG: cytochrome P450, partial [Steroidobacteraceae bacterium]
MSLRRIPDGPADPYDAEQALLGWLHEKFNQFGDIYRASIYGANVYVVSTPQYAEHVLLKNWHNYTKGQAIKRIALLLGKGLMVSEGDFWIKQRRMI